MIVMDTHTIIWQALKPEMLSRKAKQAIMCANKEDGMIFCEISLWEIAMLMYKKRIVIDVSYQEFIKIILRLNNYILQGITAEIAELSTRLSASINKDPADRIIAATAIIKNKPLVTADKNLRKSKDVLTIW